MRQTDYERIMLRRQTDRLWAEAERYEESDPKLRFRLLLKMLREGHNDPGILQNLAEAYLQGIGTKPSWRRAQDLNRRAWRRGSDTAALNAGINAQLDGRVESAAVWFRRAERRGSSDALLHLAKLLLTSPSGKNEALALLQRRVEMGEETWFEIAEGSKPRPCKDETYAEAKRLLNELARGSSITP